MRNYITQGVLVRKGFKIGHIKVEYLICKFDPEIQEISSSITIKKVEISNLKYFGI